MNEILNDLRETRTLLKCLNTCQYNLKIDVLSGASIGMHFRHVFEYYQSVLTCQESICYDKRVRNKELEQNINFALSTVDAMIGQIQEINPNRSVILIFDDQQTIKSFINRELFYCYEHSIHHKALIKIGLTSLNLEYLLSPSFGVAPATVKFQSSSKIGLG
ncbi:MAG: hypothetical protein COW03_11560 [Cytophagales bacterium CG12_big_fil_rev_8_21_14_0_65_40_12]|nr:MAG: hypothetical protein COW03_11560 [Cytophagales bacterium CG12_big_fil_rev_8_21_14_0_65_40_12]PIW03374.1 MAG: hypothetical protein COW40_15305 [Cytophagales bacterium CG17_big_fil_post_rev_8_21_14_2_50_40_13]